MSTGRMRIDWRSVRVHPMASMLQTMTVVSDGRIGIALVVDEKDHLIGTVTDGDMRRAILRGLPVDSPVIQVMQRDCTYVLPDDSLVDVINTMHKLAIRQIPVQNKSGKVIGIYVLEDLTEPRTRPNWAVLLAGGEGKRLWPMTAYVPKPMLPIGGRPVLELALTQLYRHGVKRAFISVNHLGDQIINYFGDGNNIGCSIEYLREDHPLGTGGPLALLPEIPDHAMLVINGDLVTDIDVSKLLDYHDSHEGAATVCVRELTVELPYGVVSCRNDDVVALQEKPTHEAIINVGIYVLNPAVLKLLPQNPREFPITDLIDEVRIQGMGVKAYMMKDDWLDIGRLEDYQNAQQAGRTKTF